MHTIFKLVPLTAAIALAACGGGGDKAADAACGQLEANQSDGAQMFFNGNAVTKQRELKLTKKISAPNKQNHP